MELETIHRNFGPIHRVAPLSSSQLQCGPRCGRSPGIATYVDSGFIHICHYTHYPIKRDVLTTIMWPAVFLVQHSTACVEDKSNERSGSLCLHQHWILAGAKDPVPWSLPPCVQELKDRHRPCCRVEALLCSASVPYPSVIFLSPFFFPGGPLLS